MASINVSNDVQSEINKMVNEYLNGKVSMSRFFKFLDDHNLKAKMCYIERERHPSSLNEFNTECEINKDDFEKYANDAINYIKRLVDDYGDLNEDDINHAKAANLYLSLMMLGRTYRQKAFEGDEKYNIPNFIPKNILTFIESLNLPTDKIKIALERGKSNYYYKTKKYNDFDDFESCMRDVYGIEDVWNPPEKIPEWFINVRDNLYAKFHPEDVVEMDEDDWLEFNDWKMKKDKDSFEDQCRCIVNDIIKFSPILTGKTINYFEKNYKSNNKTFMNQLKQLLDEVKSVKNCGLICFIDIDEYDRIVCNPIQNTKKDIEEKVLNAISSESDSEEPSDKKSSTSKKIPVSASVRTNKISVKKTTSKSTKTDTETKIKEFKEYADYILLNSSVEDGDARDLLLSYAANKDERCKKLYDYLVDLKKRKKSVKLVKYHNVETGNMDISFAEL